ncbi:MAG: divalent metal cation transporter [bacterium]|nr:divalent metal cation transporter [bacterium]
MFADTDAGSVITAAQSGAVYGYKLLLAQFILIPILYIVQELTVRLGILTGKGHGELIKEHYGRFWAFVSVATMVVTCIGAIITEFSGLAGVGLLFNVPKPITLSLIVIFLIFMVVTGSYKSIEKIALCIGAFELIFFIVAWKAKPNLNVLLDQMTNIPLSNPNYLYLLAANIGAVIMPWMVFYQQSAVIDKGMKPRQIKMGRWDTAIGSVLTQLIMAAILIAAAATLYTHDLETQLDTVGQITHAITPYLGTIVGKILFSLGMIGAALIASIVVTLTAAWGIGEIIGSKRSLQNNPKEAPVFYLCYAIVLILGAIFVCSDINLVNISVAVEVMNAICLPIVLIFLFLLARKALPDKYRLKGLYAVIVFIILFITSLFGFAGGIWGMI